MGLLKVSRTKNNLIFYRPEESISPVLVQNFDLPLNKKSRVYESVDDKSQS